MVHNRKSSTIHFLHIGKTGGSAMKPVLRAFADTSRHSLVLHRHGTTFHDVPPGESVVVFLRDPVSRFISGFYSRQRKGQPRYYSEWSPLEERVFGTFSTPNELALAAANSDSEHHRLAVRALRRGKHFRPYSRWCGSQDYFASRLDDVYFIGFQESLDTDFETLRNHLGLPPECALPNDDRAAHRNPAEVDKSLDDAAARMLHDWYATDIEFVAWCKAVMADRSAP